MASLMLFAHSLDQFSGNLVPGSLVMCENTKAKTWHFTEFTYFRELVIYGLQTLNALRPKNRHGKSDE